MLAAHRPGWRTLVLALIGHTILFPFSLSAQQRAAPPDAARILHHMQKLPVVGTVLYIAAHPDDENTRLITWLGNGRQLRTGYLSLTRGDGGQNLIGSELGDALGVIRTEELMAARRIDGGEQFFTRAVDFGFSKSAAESFEKWGHEAVLGDVVRVIRRFRPDVIITRFPPTREAGHGHHEASAILAREAFDLAGDPKAFPEQLEQGLQVWQPRRLFFNGSTWWKKNLAEIAGNDPDWYSVDVGGYDPLLGESYTEIAGRSRSMHKSQGFGAAETRGRSLEYLHFEKGERPTGSDLFGGMDLSWGRLQGGTAVAHAVDGLLAGYDLRAPEKSTAALARVAAAVDALPPSAWKTFTRQRVDRLLLDVTGTVVEALATVPQVVTGDSLKVELSILTRSSAPVAVMADGEAAMTLEMNVPFTRPTTLAAPDRPDQPYWLEKPHGNLFQVDNPALIGVPVAPGELQVEWTLRFDGGTTVHGTTPVIYRSVDRVKGEQERPCEVVPPVSLSAHPGVLVVQGQAKEELFSAEAFTALGRAELLCGTVTGWDFVPASQHIGPMHAGERKSAVLKVVPKGARQNASPSVRMEVDHAGPTNLTRHQVDYDHIPHRSWYTSATFKAVPMDVKVTAKRVGYVMGAGDDVPQAMQQLGVAVDLLDPTTAHAAELKRYDAIVTGIRAYNATVGMKELHPLLLQYVKEGGTLVVQYNTTPRAFNGATDFQIDPATLGPYPFQISRGRVTVEEAPPSFPNPAHPLLNVPNKITTADFEGWVQERGLYFADDLAPEYTPLITWNDPGEEPLDGALIACNHGKGRFIYTGISFFRQLPAGVPGAYRLWANLISRRTDGPGQGAK
ncbi:MAG TPA: PIG-L family deacetylase [Flavobacteriales bacterium]|nr:PIG-L family deacetylase [Flavobacteriales bacterium]